MIDSDPSQNYSEKAYNSFFLSGFAYYQGALVFSQLTIGTELDLRLDQNNEYDENAVAVYFEGTKLGYIPADNNNELAYLLKNDCPALACHVQAIHPHNEPYDQLRVVLYWKKDLKEKALALLEKRIIRPDIWENFKFENEDDYTALFVRSISWEDSHTPTSEWYEYTRLSVDTTLEERQNAMDQALKDPEFFQKCKICHEINNTGHMSGDSCHFCMEKQGVNV